MNQTDRRVQKTRKAIFEALSSLLREKKYAHITIQEIMDRANVGRTTFYAHFPTKDDLLSSCVENIFDGMTGELSAHLPQAHGHQLLPVAELFTHIRENERRVNGILVSESGGLLFEKFKSYLNAVLEPMLLEVYPDGQVPDVPVKVMANHITSTVAELLRYWLKTNMQESPEQMERYLHTLILPVITRGA